MKRRVRETGRSSNGMTETFACELKAKIPDLAKELTSSAISSKACPEKSGPSIAGFDNPGKSDDEANLILKDIIRHLTFR